MPVQTLIAIEIVQDLAGSSTGVDESAQPSLNLGSDSAAAQPPLRLVACAQFHLQERGRFLVFSSSFFLRFLELLDSLTPACSCSAIIMTMMIEIR